MPVGVPGAWGTLIAVAGEAFAAHLLGTLARTIVSGVLIAGQVIGQNIGMANIFAQGVAIDQAATLGATLYAGMVAMMFASGGHHVILRALVESYGLLPAGHFPNIAASARAVMEAGLRCFRLGGQLAFPFLLLALVFHVALAVVNRALPGDAGVHDRQPGAGGDRTVSAGRGRCPACSTLAWAAGTDLPRCCAEPPAWQNRAAATAHLKPPTAGWNRHASAATCRWRAKALSPASTSPR